MLHASSLFEPQRCDGQQQQLSQPSMYACRMQLKSGGAPIDALRVAMSKDWRRSSGLLAGCPTLRQTRVVAAPKINQLRLTHSGPLENCFAEQVSMSVSSAGGGVFCLGTRTPGLVRLVDVGQAPETWSSHASTTVAFF